jgi:hypothetical protein
MPSVVRKSRKKQDRLCLDCPRPISKGKRCGPCGAEHREAMRKNRNLEWRSPFKSANPCGRVEAKQRREVRITMRQDFLLAFPELKAEYERQIRDSASASCHVPMAMDPADLPGQRRRSA